MLNASSFDLDNWRVTDTLNTLYGSVKPKFVGWVERMRNPTSLVNVGFHDVQPNLRRPETETGDLIASDKPESALPSSSAPDCAR